MISDLNPHVMRYIELVETGEIAACKEQKLLVKYIRRCFETEEIYTDGKQLLKYLSLSKYFPYEKVFEWQAFCIALHDCTYRKSVGMPRWPDMLCLIGRGAGKDGFIALESFCLMSPYNGIKNYDVDVCANNEDQALRPLRDLLEVLNNPAQQKKLAVDNFRYALLANSLRKIGSDTGNFVYGKIEAKSRKTDPFMALVASMVIEDELGDGGCADTPDIPVFVY